MISVLEVWNWCQHEHKRYEFAPGLTAIIGPNGSGKSNLMGAVKWLWTGMNPNAGNKEDNIRTLSQQHERSKGFLQLINRGRTFDITRHLRPSTEAATLLVNGDAKAGARGETAVTNKLAELYGLDPKMVGRFMLVAQDDLFGFLAEQPEVRSKLFQQLFDTAHGTRCVKAIVDHDAKLRVPTLGVDIDQLTAMLTDIQGKLVQAQTVLAATVPIADFAAAQSADQRIIDARTAYVAAEQENMRLQADIAAKTTLLQADQAQLKLLNDSAAQLELVVNTDRAATDAARAALANLQTYTAIENQRQTWQTRLTQLRGAGVPAPTIPDEQPVPAAPAQNPEIASRQELSRTKRQELRKDIEFVRQFRTTGTANCPTCRTPATTIEAVVAEVEKGIPARTQELDGYDQGIASLIDAANSEMQAWSIKLAEVNRANASRNTAVAAHATWQRNETARTQEIAILEQNLANQQTTAAPIGDASVWSSAVVTYDECVKTLQESRTAIASLSSRVASAEGTLHALKQQATQLLQKLATPVTQADADAASTRLTQRATAQNQYAEATRAEAILQSQVENLSRQLGEAAGQKRQVDAMRFWLTEGEQVQAALKQAQKIVLQRKLQQAEGEMNMLLELCDLDYRVTADEMLSFTAAFRDGRVQPAPRLSGGQKGILAMLFRIANAIQFAENLDVLFLDEPTAYLDKKSINAFIPIFERLRSVLADRGLQVIIITHEEDLAPLFDRVISL